MSVDLAVTNSVIVTADGRTGPNCGIAVNDGTIVAIGTSDSLPSADEVIDVEGRYIVPGIVDTHIHNRSPGYEYKEDWETATRAAAAGGVTSVVGMPNNDPTIDRPEHLRRKFELGEENAIVDFQTYAVLTSDNLDQIAPLDEAGVLGYKVFLGTYIDSLAPPNDGELHEAMSAISETGKRVGFHTENREIVRHYREKFQAEGRTDPMDYARSRPVVSEVEGTSRVTVLAADADCPIHVFQLSTGSAARVIRRAREDGVDVTAETTPHYLWFSEDAMKERGALTSIQPPLRPSAERASLWQTGIDEGVIDCIATDHSPHTDEEKGLAESNADIWDVATGFVGLETEVPAMLTFVDQGRLSLERWIALHSTGPSKVWGMYPRKGSLRIGTDADFTVVDPDREWVLDRSTLHSKNTATPFDGERFVGAVTDTFVRGTRVYGEGSILESPGYGSRIDVD